MNLSEPVVVTMNEEMPLVKALGTAKVVRIKMEFLILKHTHTHRHKA